MRVLVTGATGFVGRHLVPALTDAGHSVRALVRSRSASLPDGVEPALGTITDRDSIRRAAEGCDACVHLVAIIVERGERTFERINHQGTHAVVDALREAGVPRLVHQSALGVGPDPRFPYLASKAAGERAVMGSDLDWTILRPSVLYGEGAGFFRPIVWTLRWMPLYPLPAGGRTLFQPLAIGDLVRCIVGALDGEASRDRVDLGGPDVLSFRDLVEVCAKVLGKRRTMVDVPLWAARPFALVQQLRREPLVTNRQLDMVVLDNVCDADSVKRAFGFEPRRFATDDLRWLARL